MTYNEAAAYLYTQLPMFQRDGASAYRKDLVNTRKLCDHFGNPQQKLRCIHVAGTNGKGSTSHMLASILQEKGLKVGLNTSPHLKSFTERIRINGATIREDFVAEFVGSNKAFFGTFDPSFFEITAVMAFAYFTAEKVDIAVIETGMGGKLDSTNIITPVLSVITNIGWDHMQFLGDTLPEIAQQKAGIIKKKVPVVIGERQEQVQEVFDHAANMMDAPCIFADDFLEVQQQEHITEDGKEYLQVTVLNTISEEETIVKTDLLGAYQVKNIVTVLAAIDEMNESLEMEIDELHVKQGLANVSANTGLAGRWQVLGSAPLIIADAGHNKPGLELVLGQLQTQKYATLRMVIGFVNDKDIDGLLNMLPEGAVYYFTQASIPRAMDAEALAGLARKKGLQGNVYPAVQEALDAAKSDAAPSDLIFVGGSTFVVAEVV